MKVGIVGGGLGGLTLAAFLRRKGLEPVVFERDEAPSSRGQGYALGLKKDGALPVLDALGLRDEVERVGRPASDFAMLTPSGKRLMTLKADPKSPAYTLGVPRDALRGLLLQAAGADLVRWGTLVRGYEAGEGSVRVTIEGSDDVEVDLLVGADGSRSAVRGDMFGDPLSYLGLTQVGGLTRAPVTHPLLDGGAFMTLGRGDSMFIQRYAESGETIWSYCTRVEEGSLDALPAAERVGWALERVAGWHEPIAEVVRTTEPGETAVRGYYDRDPRQSYIDGRVLLLGDAAHPMSPFQGQGANTAMLDAKLLSEALLAPAVPGGERVAFEGALQRWDREMSGRARKVVMRSRQAASMFHPRGGAGAWLRDAGMRALGLLMPG